MTPLRLLVFDRTCRGRRGLPGLSAIWRGGQTLYRGMGRIDGARGVAGWAEAFDWLASFRPTEPIAEIQYWGHGRFGEALVGGESLSVASWTAGHAHAAGLRAIAARLCKGSDGLVWFRTCETFGTAAGHAFARTFARNFGCQVAGHTHVIAVWQSGLHALLPGGEPDWSEDEGVVVGSPTSRFNEGAGLVAHAPGAPSRPGAPNTVSFLTGRIPPAFVSR